jgi:hypothetical protein
MMGRPVILLDETPAGNCFIRVPSSAGGESGDSSGSAIETTGSQLVTSRVPGRKGVEVRG